MTDPYNSHSPYSPPRTNLVVTPPPLPPKASAIDALDVSPKWKARFRAIEKAGGARLTKLRDLDKAERNLVNRNWPAFFFWPVYFPAKGLWRQAISYFLIAMALVFLFELVGLGRYSRVVGYGMGAVAAFRANLGYYKRVVLGQASWL
ncbi:DUF2628 domain-containing protein [Lysobacter sp. HA35]